MSICNKQLTSIAQKFGPTSVFNLPAIFVFLNKQQHNQWLIAQLVERSLSVMKDPGSNLGTDICLFRY
jgi:hypothetical protein